jgi:hypothetical protein
VSVSYDEAGSPCLLAFKLTHSGAIAPALHWQGRGRRPGWLDLRFRGSRQPAQAARMRGPGRTSRKGAALGANKRRAGPGGWRRAPLARARPSPHGGLIFQSIIRFGMTGWVGDPAIGSSDLPSPPVDGPQPLVQPGRPLRGSPLCSGKRLWPVETPCSGRI